MSISKVPTTNEMKFTFLDCLLGLTLIKNSEIDSRNSDRIQKTIDLLNALNEAAEINFKKSGTSALWNVFKKLMVSFDQTSWMKPLRLRLINVLETPSKENIQSGINNLSDWIDSFV
jgi:hypothetical protein